MYHYITHYNIVDKIAYFFGYSGKVTMAKSINVKKSRKVKAGDVIGEVYTDRDGVTELEFQVYKGTTKLDPEQWLAMK